MFPVIISLYLPSLWIDLKPQLLERSQLPLLELRSSQAQELKFVVIARNLRRARAVNRRAQPRKSVAKRCWRTRSARKRRRERKRSRSGMRWSARRRKTRRKSRRRRLTGRKRSRTRKTGRQMQLLQPSKLDRRRLEVKTKGMTMTTLLLSL